MHYPSLASPQEKTPIFTRKPEKPRNKNLTKVSNQESAVDSQLNMSALTPMPNYTSMDTPNLKENLKQYGIKPLSKNQAVKKLVEIYEFTHKHKLQRSQSCVGLSEKHVSDKNGAPKVSGVRPSCSNTNLSSAIMTTEEFLIDQAAKQMNLEKIDKPAKKRTLKKTVSDIGFQMNSGNPQPTLSKVGVKPKKNVAQKSLQECTIDDHMLAMIENEDSDSSPSVKSSQFAQKKSKILDEEETHETVQDVIRNDENLYLSVLNYEPVDYEHFFNRLQTLVAPRKINKQYLMKALDEFCITFTLKNLNTRATTATTNKLKSKKKT